MSDQQAELNSAIAEVKSAIAAEIAEIKTIIEGIQPGKPLDLSELSQLKAVVAGMSNAVSPSTPAEGKHNVSLGFRSTGEESFNASIIDNNCDEEQAIALKGLYDAAVAAGQAQAPGGASFESTLYFSDNGVSTSVSFDNELQKAAADKAVGESIVALASAQLGQ